MRSNSTLKQDMTFSVVFILCSRSLQKNEHHFVSEQFSIDIQNYLYK
jgi:hypothetical protein